MSVGIQAMKDVYTKFFRKGQVGDWKNYFEGENLSQWDQWIAENLKGTDLEMVFEWIKEICKCYSIWKFIKFVVVPIEM